MQEIKGSRPASEQKRESRYTYVSHALWVSGADQYIHGKVIGNNMFCFILFIYFFAFCEIGSNL